MVPEMQGSGAGQRPLPDLCELYCKRRTNAFEPERLIGMKEERVLNIVHLFHLREVMKRG